MKVIDFNLLKLSYPIDTFFEIPAGFELRTFSIRYQHTNKVTTEISIYSKVLSKFC